MNLLASKTAATDKIAISNYKVLELIGSGGMANIYQAIQLSLDRVVALKIMHQHLTMNEGFVTRFEKEAKQAAQLHHENIVSIIDYGYENGNYYIAMEYVDGKNLRQILERQRRLPLEVGLLICHQVAEGLKYAHNQNLVHRDIKPANIILSNDGRVMITDFGIAKGDDDLSITATGQMIGSPAYMSPEQAAGRLMDHRSDIFSLGIILYEVLAGEKPFKGETYQAMVTSIMSQTPRSLRKIRIDVNDEIEKIFEKAIEKDVESRYQSAEEIAEDIYAQLDKFKLPSARKLIPSFLKNPSKVTEKLRTEKVSSHMESALYFLTQGESRLKDAKREFEDVLRFDKNNKYAKKYLAKLENHITVQDSSNGDTKSRFLRIFVKIIVPLVILAGLISGFMIISARKGVNTEKASDKTETETVQKDTKNSGGQTGSSETGKSKSGDGNVQKSRTDTGGSTKKTNTGSGKTTRKTTTNEKQVAKQRNSAYNYPNQNLKEYGLLTVKTNVVAEVYVDLTRYGLSNGPAIKLKPGRHFVEIKADGYRRMTRRIFTEKNGTVDLRIDLIPER